MKIFGFEITNPWKKETATPLPPVKSSAEFFDIGGVGGIGAAPYLIQGYDGETNLGAVGPIKLYSLEYEALRWRSRQLYIENIPCQTLVDRHVMWVIGKGLVLQAEPIVPVLNSMGIDITDEQAEEFAEKVESFFKVYMESKMADYAGVKTGGQILAETEKHRVLSGDVLWVLRVINGIVKIQQIDASLVSTPLGLAIKENEMTTGMDYYTTWGNRVRKGVEIDAAGRHVAYYVRVGLSNQHERVLARGRKSGMLMAYLVYGKKTDITSERGTPKLATNIETAATLDRYIKAVLSSVEEKAKLPFFFEHNQDSVQEDPAEGARVKAYAGFAGESAADVGIPITDNGVQKLNSIIVTGDRTIYDLPKGVTIKTVESDQEADFPGFTKFHMTLQASSFGMPETVASGNYDGSFSSSRVGTKDWEHTIDKERLDVTSQAMQPVYALQVYLLALNNYVDAMPLVQAFEAGNDLVINAYLSARWEGDQFPDIDERKEAQAIRESLGEELAGAPFMTMEAATRKAGQGDFRSVIRQLAKERKLLEAAGFPTVSQTSNTASAPKAAPVPPADAETEMEEDD